MSLLRRGYAARSRGEAFLVYTKSSAKPVTKPSSSGGGGGGNDGGGTGGRGGGGEAEGQQGVRSDGPHREIAEAFRGIHLYR